MAINLEDIIDALEMTNDQTRAYLDTKTGKILWQYDFEPSFNDIKEEDLDVERYKPLPDKYEINEYHMIEAFAYDKGFVQAIKGRGAFRRFKDKAEELGLLEEWYEFRRNCYYDRAIRWCQGNGLKGMKIHENN